MDQAIIDVQHLFWDALKSKDKQLFEQILADEFVSVSLTQPNQTRAEFIATLTSFPAKVNSVETENLQVYLFGDVAILTALQIAHIQLPDGTIIRDKIALSNVFKRVDHGWRMVLARPVELSS
jgi:ketosteroid isomerase-like protein